MFVMLCLRGYLKISPEGYCTFSVVSEGNGCQESHFAELNHLFFLLFTHMENFLHFNQDTPIPIHQRLKYLAELTAMSCPLQMTVITYRYILHGSHFVVLFPEWDLISKRDC